MKKIFIMFCVICTIMFGLIPTSDAASKTARQRRWQNPKSIKTYVPPKHRDTAMMKRAFAEWSRKTNNRIVFKYVSTKTEADITVRFLDKIENCGESHNAIGCARSTYFPCTQSSCRFKHVYVDIADKTTSGRKLSNKVEIYTTMLHEIGHAIGLGHNAHNKYSIMSTDPYRSVLKQEIDKEDLAKLAEIYNW